MLDDNTTRLSLFGSELIQHTQFSIFQMNGKSNKEENEKDSEGEDSEKDGRYR